MPITTALLLLLATPQAEPDTKTFVTTDRLLEMQIPKSWTVAKEKSRQVISYKAAAGQVKIEVYATKYLQTAEDWQTMQRTVNEQMKRTVVRQWEEEIMSVPMLLSSIKYSEPKEGEVGVLIGLLYSNTSEKFHFRLVAPLANFDDAQSAWRDAWLTMRTSTGKPPTAEDGNPESVAPVAPVPEGRTIMMSGQQAQSKPLGPVKFSFTTSGRSGVLRFPKGTQVTDGSPMKIKCPNLNGELTAQVMSADDSPASGLFVMQEVNKDLARFKVVNMRENVGPKRNTVGAQIFSTTRTGTSDTGDLQTFIGVVDSGKFYLVLRFEATDAKQFKKQHETLTQFSDKIGFELTP